MDAYREKQLLERIAKLEQEIEKLKQPWTHNFSGLGYTPNWNTTTTSTATF